MNYDTYEKIEKLSDVKHAGSEYNKDPLLDECVTIFLKSGYRIISTKSLLGQALELDPFPQNNNNPQPSYKVEIYYKLDTIENPEDSFVKLQHNEKKRIDLNSFLEDVSKIVSPDVLDFLKARHEKTVFFSQQNIRIR